VPGGAEVEGNGEDDEGGGGTNERIRSSAMA
jgi:hypothetical protein